MVLYGSGGCYPDKLLAALELLLSIGEIVGSRCRYCFYTPLLLQLTCCAGDMILIAVVAVRLPPSLGSGYA